jgi:hypothetical protein
MTAIARIAMLDARTVAPYRYQGLLIVAVYIALFVNRPTVLVPALVMLVAATVAAYPFNVADKADLNTLYAVLPISRRSVVWGHYAWAAATFVVTAGAGTTLALVFAHAQRMPFGGRLVATELTLSWTVFAAVIAIQFPLFIRYGYSRTSALATALPLATIVGIAYRSYLTVASVHSWLPLIAAAAVAAMVVSAAVAVRGSGTPG